MNRFKNALVSLVLALGGVALVATSYDPYFRGFASADVASDEVVVYLELSPEDAAKVDGGTLRLEVTDPDGLASSDAMIRVSTEDEADVIQSFASGRAYAEIAADPVCIAGASLCRQAFFVEIDADSSPTAWSVNVDVELLLVQDAGTPDAAYDELLRIEAR